MRKNKEELIAKIKQHIDIYAMENCNECEVCTRKDCPLHMVLTGKVNIYGTPIIPEIEATYEEYEEFKKYKEE